MLKPSLNNLLDQCFEKDGLYWLCRGPVVSPPQRLYLLVGTHGNEIAGPLALQTLKELLEEGWRWPNVAMTAVFQDFQGWKEEGYGFVGPEGETSMWPPLWGYPMNRERYWNYYDENSAWGSNVVQTPRHEKMKELMEVLEPTFMLTLHETAYTEVERSRFWAGAGMTLIEAWPVSASELNRANDWVGYPPNDFVGWAVRVLVEWLRDMVGIRRWRFARRALLDNPHYKLTTEAADRYIELGGRLTETRWTRYQEVMQQLTIGPGRVFHSPVMIMSEWRTAMDYAACNFGCPGVTTETFQCAEVGLRGIDQRVEQQLTYVHAVLDTLEGQSHEID